MSFQDNVFASFLVKVKLIFTSKLLMNKVEITTFYTIKMYLFKNFKETCGIIVVKMYKVKKRNKKSIHRLSHA